MKLFFRIGSYVLALSICLLGINAYAASYDKTKFQLVVTRENACGIEPKLTSSSSACKIKETSPVGFGKGKENFFILEPYDAKKNLCNYKLTYHHQTIPIEAVEGRLKFIHCNLSPRHGVDLRKSDAQQRVSEACKCSMTSVKGQPIRDF
jgi:hypothetical protein